VTHRQFGEREKFRGYVTTLSSVTGRRTSQLEQALGFAPGSLSAGYFVYALAEPIGSADFEWKDRTTYSDGWHYDPTIGEYVQRQDELRAHWGKVHNYNEPATDAKLGEIMAPHIRRLNARAGPERVVKVLPKGPISAFPDSPLRGVPQWKLRFPKSFDRLADISPGGMVV
jgi:hypothetical protein